MIENAPTRTSIPLKNSTLKKMSSNLEISGFRGNPFCFRNFDLHGGINMPPAVLDLA
jgi:hypothetical protein